MLILLYIFAICFAALFLLVTVNRFERNRPLATLLMFLILGVTAAAVLNQLVP
jgi:predicted MFS family arabinose efflux permease